MEREREQLVGDGFCIVPGVLDAGMLDSLRRESSALLDQLSEEEKRVQGGQAGHRASTGGVPPASRQRLLPLLPRYSGTAEPAATNRRRGDYLKKV